MQAAGGGAAAELWCRAWGEGGQGDAGEGGGRDHGRLRRLGGLGWCDVADDHLWLLSLGLDLGRVPLAVDAALLLEE